MSAIEENEIMGSSPTCSHATSSNDWMQQMHGLARTSSASTQQYVHASEEPSLSQKTPAAKRSQPPVRFPLSYKDKCGLENSKNETSKSVSIPNEQWDQLVASINNLSQLLEGTYPEEDLFAVHNGIICDGCDQFPSHVELRTRSQDGYIRGPRFKCLDCCDYDLCVDCEERNVTSLQHESTHRMAKIKVPEGNSQYRFTERWCKRCPTESTETHSAHSEASASPEYIDKQTNCAVALTQSSVDAKLDFSNTTPCAPLTKDDDLSSLVPKYGKDISEVVQKLEQFEELLKSSNLNYDQLMDMVAKHALNPPDTSPASASTIAGAPDAAGILVELKSVDYLLSLHLTNNTGETLPGELCLTLEYTCESGAVAAKNINTGPHELPNGFQKTVNFNHRGPITSLQPGDKLRLNLYDHDKNLLYTYNSYRTGRIIMRSPNSDGELTLDDMSRIVGNRPNNANSSDWYVVRYLSDDNTSLSTALPNSPSVKDDEFDLLSDSEFESL